MSRREAVFCEHARVRVFIQALCGVWAAAYDGRVDVTPWPVSRPESAVLAALAGPYDLDVAEDQVGSRVVNEVRRSKAVA